ncbi:MAG: helix-turn-helix domain-containing protein [Acetivibrio ethanolgignens]
MAVSYNRLWKLLVDKKMSSAELRRKCEISPNTLTKLKRDEEVSLFILEKICAVLETDFGDIIEYIDENTNL